MGGTGVQWNSLPTILNSVAGPHTTQTGFCSHLWHVKITIMLIYFCLFLLTLGGVALGTIPATKFNLLTELSKSPVYLWSGSLKAFGVPLSLLLLRISKNPFLRIVTALWGLYLSILSGIIFIRISDMAPSTNLYGTLFLSSILITSFSIFLFSLLELAPLLPKAQKKLENTPLSTEVEGTNETPTNPS